MRIDEKTRLDLRQWFEARMGERLAHALMEAMPPIDYHQLATKTDVDVLGRELRAEMSELRSELRGEMSGLRGEMSELRSELHLEIANQTRLLVAMQVMTFGATMAAIIGMATFLST